MNADRPTISQADSVSISAVSKAILSLRFSPARPRVIIDFEILEGSNQLLETVFGDPDRKAIAQRKMRDLQQKNHDFPFYLSGFND